MRAGNPNPYYCTEDVHDTFGAGFSQCGNKPKKGSEFCGTHSPEAKARREAKSEAGYQAWKGKVLAPSREIEQLKTINDDLLAALEAAFIEKDDDVFYRTRGNIPMDVPERIARKVRAAFAKSRRRE